MINGEKVADRANLAGWGRASPISALPRELNDVIDSDLKLVEGSS